VNGPEGSLTLVGTPESLTSGLAAGGIERLPSKGEVVLGPGIDAGDVLQLTGAARSALKVVGRMTPATSMVTHDLVLTHPDDARRLLGIGEGYVSDLAVDVFHDQEIEAIAPDLSRAFPWPVQISTRREAIAQFSGGLMRRGGLVCLALVPAVLALGLILAGTLKHAAAHSQEAGLLKAFGWTTTDLVHLQLVQAILTGLPAVMVGLSIAYALVCWPGATWPGRLFFGWKLRSPELCLDTGGAGLVLAVIGALVFLPYMAASLWPVLRTASVDPVDVIQRDYV
jgi:ABC-type lipoprotein release transport system permease subunit